MTELADLRRRGHARTNFKPEEFIEAYEAAETLEEMGEIREILKSLDGGRFYPFLNEGHNVLAKSDSKRRKAFVENHSDHLIRWIKAFGKVEDLTTFPRIDA